MGKESEDSDDTNQIFPQGWQKNIKIPGSTQWVQGRTRSKFPVHEEVNRGKVNWVSKPKDRKGCSAHHIMRSE